MQYREQNKVNVGFIWIMHMDTNDNMQYVNRTLARINFSIEHAIVGLASPIMAE